MRAIVFYAALFGISAPVATLIHELGHALVAFAFTSQRVHVRLGSGSLPFGFSLGRLAVHFRLLPGFVGRCTVENGSEVPRLRLVWIFLAGPLMSLAALGGAFAVSGVVAESGLEPYVRALFWVFVVQAVLTLVPIRYPSWIPGYGGKTSDGLNVLRRLSS